MLARLFVFCGLIMSLLAGSIAFASPHAVASSSFASSSFASSVSSFTSTTSSSSSIDFIESIASQSVFDALSSGQRLDPPEVFTPNDVVPEQPTVYLTFDDGPSKLTPRVLDILQDEGIQATFFALGEMAEEYPDTIRRIVNEGHTLGNHTYNHVYKELYSDFNVFWQQIQQTEDIFDRIAGVRPKFVRAPGGTATNFDSFYFYYLAQTGYRVMDWTVDSADSKRVGVPAAEIIRQVKNSPLKHEIILLLHDGAGHGQSVKALPEIIQFYKEKGYAFAPFTDQVKPVQFTSGKIKWNRSNSYESFVRKVDHIDAVKRQTQAVEQAKAKADAEKKQAQVQPPKLTVSLGNAEWDVPQDRYGYQNDRFSVSLRSLAEKMGARVEWDEARGTATVYYGLRAVEYTPHSGIIREFLANGTIKTHHFADIRFEDEQIRLPLRLAAETLGYQVAHYDELDAGNSNASQWMVELSGGNHMIGMAGLSILLRVQV